MEDQANRPKIVSGLAILWLVAAIAFPIVGVRAYIQTGVVLHGDIVAAAISGLLAYGLWVGQPWARVLQIIVFVPTMCLMPVSFVAIILLGYMTRPETKRYFVPSSGGRAWESGGRWAESEWPWILASCTALVAGLALLVEMAPLFRAWR